MLCCTNTKVAADFRNDVRTSIFMPMPALRSTAPSSKSSPGMTTSGATPTSAWRWCGCGEVREAEIANVLFLGVLAGCSARRSERRVASHTSEEQRRNAPGSAAKNGILVFSASLSCQPSQSRVRVSRQTRHGSE